MSKELKEDFDRIQTYAELSELGKPERCNETEWNKILASAYMREKGHDLDLVPMWEKAGFRVYKKVSGHEMPWYFLQDHKKLIAELERIVELL